MINDTKLQAAMRRAGCLLALAAAFSVAVRARRGAALYHGCGPTRRTHQFE
jgi:hypothetical protein